MKIITLIIISLLSFAAGSYAQNIPSGSCGIVFTYDAAGNRSKMEYYCNNGARLAVSDSVTTNSKDMADAVEVDILYPNPTSGKFWINFAKPIKNEKIFIMDGNGKPVRQVTGNGSRVEFDLSTAPNGIYFIKIENNGTNIIKKVMKF